MGLPALLTLLAILGVLASVSMVKAQTMFPHTISSRSAGSTPTHRTSTTATSAIHAAQPAASVTAPQAKLTIVYQDNFGRKGELDGSAPAVVDLGGAIWSSSNGANQYATSGSAAAVSTFAYGYSVAYLPVNGASSVTLDGTKDFTLSVKVTPGATGRTGISLNTGTLLRYSNLFTNDFAALSTSSGFAGAYAFNGGNIGYNYAPGISGPTTISLNYCASARTLTYTVGHTTVYTQSGVTATQVAAIRYVAMGNDGYGGGAATPEPSFGNFTFAVGGSVSLAATGNAHSSFWADAEDQ